MNDRQSAALKTATEWVAAEADGDATAIDRLLAGDFTGVGPLGFVLSRTDWLDRHASGALQYSSLRLEEPVVRVYEEHAVVLAVQTGEASYQGHPVPQTLRATIMLRRTEDGWRVAHVHTSFVAGTPGAPPIPGRN